MYVSIFYRGDKVAEKKIRILGSSVGSNAADCRYRDEVLVFHALENAWASTWLSLAALNLEFYGRTAVIR